MVNKRTALIIIFVAFLLSAYSSYSYFSGSLLPSIISPIIGYKPPDGSNEPTIPAEPKTEECPINGEMLTKTQKANWEKRRPLGVMIENHKDARPQSGLSSADVVYEAVAEGGITRFLAIYYCKDAPFIGPVRSARIYFIQMLEEYGNNPLYAHVGGANTPGPADALGEIKDLGWNYYNDLNQFAVPFPYYWRDFERLPGVANEHTVYSTTSKLWQYAAAKRELTNVDSDGVAWDKNFISWKFVDDVKLEDRGQAKKISFGFWNSFASDFSVDWIYNKSSNSYVRNTGGQPNIDKNTGKSLEAKNIVIIFASERPANDGYEGGHILYKLNGEGESLIFQNGKTIKATWSKEDDESRMKFTDENGKEISFVRGQVFVEILPIGNKVSY